jgi:excisionase family DNA binding protein
MNFADAIRQASRDLHTSPEFSSNSAVTPLVTVITPPTTMDIPNDTEKAPAEVMAHDGATPELETLRETTVKLEMTLTPSQISALFHSVAISQHSVLTSREAGAHLRVSVAVLERMAQEGQIPAFILDGKWRFAKAALDEWVAVQTTKKEAS